MPTRIPNLIDLYFSRELEPTLRLQRLWLNDKKKLNGIRNYFRNQIESHSAVHLLFKFSSTDFSVSFPFSFRSFHSFSPLPDGSNL